MKIKKVAKDDSRTEIVINRGLGYGKEKVRIDPDANLLQQVEENVAKRKKDGNWYFPDLLKIDSRLLCIADSHYYKFCT